jgi:hypothetical protein
MFESLLGLSIFEPLFDNLTCTYTHLTKCTLSFHVGSDLTRWQQKGTHHSTFGLKLLIILQTLLITRKTKEQSHSGYFFLKQLSRHKSTVGPESS